MSESILSLVGALVVGLLLLILEYRTNWLARNIKRTIRQQTNSINEYGLVDAMLRIRNDLARLHSADSNLVSVETWEWRRWKLGKRLRLVMKIQHDRKGQPPTYAKYVVWADRRGKILYWRDITVPIGIRRPGDWP